jgi:hypothetical protein
MVLPPLHQSASLYLAWIGGLCGGVVLLLGNLLPFPVPFATPDAFFACIVELEVFFVLLLWPLFVPALLKQNCPPPLLMAYVGVLLLFALPLVLVAANVASVGAGGVIRSQALVAALAALGAGVAARFRAALPWYLLGVFWFSVAHPFWAFLGHEMGARSPGGAVYLSPFWGAVAAESAPAWVQAALCGLGGLALLALPARKEAA